MKNLLLDYSLSEINQQKFFDYILLHIGDRITQKEIFGKNFSHPCWNFLIANQYGDKLKDFLYAAISQSKDNFVLFASFVWEGYIKNDLDWRYVRCFVNAAEKLGLASLSEILGYAAASFSVW